MGNNNVWGILFFSFFSVSFFTVLPVFAGSVDLDPLFYESNPENMNKALTSRQKNIGDWVEDLNSKNLSLLCLGERHDDKYRSYLSKNFFNGYKFDVMFMEARQDQVERLVKESRESSEEVDFLGADIGPVIRAALETNPNLKFIGVELTKKQKNVVTFEGNLKSREGFIAQNVSDHLERGKRHLMFYGANHCAKFDIGLGNKTPAYRHLEKIIAAYDGAVEVDKYMRVVDVAEIAENDYNLNISRYIDTSEPEPIVDLQLVKTNIAKLEEKERAIDAQLVDFLKELGI